MRLAYTCPIEDAVLMVHGWGWGFGPLNGMAEQWLRVRRAPELTWLRRALRYRVRVRR